MLMDISTLEFIVSTDLDGTLLDHDTYSWSAALPAIAALQERQIPIVFNTSKTFDEARQLQRNIGIQGPLIVENGSALFLPNSFVERIPVSAASVYDEEWRVIEFGAEKSNIHTFIQEQRLLLGSVLEGYSDWSLEKICEMTGLSLEDAKLSACKKYSEPFIWSGSEQDFTTFSKNAHAANFRILKGGRFFHLQGMTDKGKPLLWLRNTLTKIMEASAPNNERVKIIALGDNFNDVQMLNVADYPICVKSPVSDYPKLNTSAKIIYTSSYGPEGWNAALSEMFL